jgi:hypothetical protein
VKVNDVKLNIDRIIYNDILNVKKIFIKFNNLFKFMENPVALNKNDDINYL